jgi:hypothetical protein
VGGGVEVAIHASALAERDMDVDAGHTQGILIHAAKLRKSFQKTQDMSNNIVYKHRQLFVFLPNNF